MRRADLHTRAMSNGSAPPKKRGCLFYGCLSVVGVGLVILITLVLGYYFTKRWAFRQVTQYTDTTNAVFEKVEYTPAQRDDLNRRVQRFTDAIQKGVAGQELIVTANDINVLLSENADLKGRLFVALEGERVKGRLSLPLNDYIPLDIRKSLTVLEGRYLNASATFRVALEGGMLDVRLEEAEAKGKPLDKLPFFGRFITELKKTNLVMTLDSQNRVDTNAMSRWDSLQVKDGQIILKSKGTQ